MTRNVISLHCRYSPRRDKPTTEKDIFQILFLHTGNETVEAWETNSIELEDLINHLRAGWSVFINPKKQNRRLTECFGEEEEKSAYFDRI